MNMKHIVSRWFRFIGPVLAGSMLLLSLTTCAGRAVEEATPAHDAAAILNSYIQATGGLEAYNRIHNRVTRGTFEIAQMGLKGALTLYHARPNQLYFLLELEGVGTITSGISGEVAWENSVTTGPRVKTDQEQADALRDAIFERFTYWRQVYREAEYAGEETIDGTPCYKVILKPETGRPQMLYFDQESRLIVKVSATIEHQMGDIAVESFPADYREVDGILVPHWTTVKVMGQERIITAESVEHNVELPAGIFDLPEDIQALVEQSGGE